MAGFHTKTFTQHDDYMSPNSAWDNIKHIIDKRKDDVIWEAFYGDGKSGEYLKSMGYNVIHEKIDFFENDCGDWILSNPPFSKSREVLTRLKELNKPFIIILPTAKLTTNYFKNLFGNENIQLIIPRKRIHFKKLVNGEIVEGWRNKCNFDCFYYCYKMGLEKDILFLDN